MKKILVILILFLLTIGLVEAATVSLSITWQLSSETLKPGRSTTISVTATNAGTSDITNVVIDATPGPYLSITSGGSTTLGAIPATTSQQASISIKAKDDALTTTSYVLLNVDYYTGTNSYSKSVYIPIYIKREPILQITNVQYNDTTAPGNTVMLSFDVTNYGSGPATDITIILNQSDDTFITPGSSGETHLTSVGAGQSRKVEFIITIDPDADVGTDSIPVILEYYDESSSDLITKTKEIGLTIGGDVQLITTVESSLGSTAKITITNIGTGSAEYLLIKVSSPYTTKEIYIGSLESDDYETIEIAQAGISATYPLTLNLTYKDKYNNEFNEERTINVTPIFSFGDLPIGYIILILIIIGAWYWFKKRKKKK